MVGSLAHNRSGQCGNPQRPPVASVNHFDSNPAGITVWLLLVGKQKSPDTPKPDSGFADRQVRAQLPG